MVSTHLAVGPLGMHPAEASCPLKPALAKFFTPETYVCQSSAKIQGGGFLVQTCCHEPFEHCPLLSLATHVQET